MALRGATGQAAALAFLVMVCGCRIANAMTDDPLLLLNPARDSKDLGDVAQTCDVDAVQVANIRQLYPILHDLIRTTFFRLFRVNLKHPSCPFWKSPNAEKEESGAAAGGTCAGSLGGGAGGSLFPFQKPFGGGSSSAFQSQEPPEPACGYHAEEELAPVSSPASPSRASKGKGGEVEDEDDDNNRLDRSMTTEERVASVQRVTEAASSCEFEEDLPTYWVDMCPGDGGKAGQLEDVNLIKNPERNTGYNGSHIWDAMYRENCFEVGSELPRGRYGADGAGMCYEERVLYRLLSGWHASTSISIAKNFYAPGTKLKDAWAANLERFMSSVGQHPQRAKNLHFSFVVMLRAIKKAAPYLHANAYSTGDGREDNVTKNLMLRLLDSQVLSVCSPLFEAFDETRLFRDTTPEQRSKLKRQFKSVFRNITVIVDCVQCQRCRLHAKLYSQGLGAALKILLSPIELIPSTISQGEVVALVNVLWKLSEAMEDARLLTQQYWQQHAEGLLPEQLKAAALLKVVYARTGAAAAAAAAAGTSTLPSSAPTAAPLDDPSELRLLLDAAIGAVRRASSAGALTPGGEEQVLRSLVVRPAADAVLLLARHYAADRPELFASLALEAAGAEASAGVAQRASRKVAGQAGPVDAVVIGGGLAGMVASLSLLDRGAQVVLIEKQPFLGGNSGKASSGINAAIESSVESLVADTTKSAGSLARPDLIEKLSKDSTSAVSWLRDRTEVDLSLRSQLGGHTVQRTLRPSNAFVGAELTFAAGQLLQKMAASRPEQLRILTKATWTGLARGGAGWRASVSVNGSETVVEAVSVVIASGGFGHDFTEAESLLLNNRPDLAGFPTTLGPHTTGDGVKIARDLGAKLVDMDRVQLHPTGFVDPSKPNETTKTLAAELLRGVGGLLLDREGRRFTDELGTRQAVVNAELKAAGEGRGLPPPAPPRAFTMVLNGKAAAMADRHVTLYSKKGLLTKVHGIEALARHLRAPEGLLRATLAMYDAAARAGRDAFGRSVFPEGHWPIEEDEDFYVGQVVPVVHYTMGGIAIDTSARVLAEADGKPIQGLYAIGEASGGVHGDNRLAGNSLLECTVFGRHVGLTLPVRPAAAVGAAAAAPPPDAAGAAVTPSGGLRKIAAEELGRHRTQEQGSWVSLFGDVYDLTAYVEEHPGGAEAILNVAGTDGTETFNAVHNRRLLDDMGFQPIGVLA